MTQEPARDEMRELEALLTVTPSPNLRARIRASAAAAPPPSSRWMVPALAVGAGAVALVAALVVSSARPHEVLPPAVASIGTNVVPTRSIPVGDLGRPLSVGARVELQGVAVPARELAPSPVVSDAASDSLMVLVTDQPALLRRYWTAGGPQTVALRVETVPPPEVVEELTVAPPMALTEIEVAPIVVSQAIVRLPGSPVNREFDPRDAGRSLRW